MTNLLELMDRGIGGVSLNPTDLAPEVIAFGEPEAAELLLAMSPDTHAQIGVLAGRLLSGSFTIDKAICLAAVEVFEGHVHPLRGKRRVYPKAAV